MFVSPTFYRRRHIALSLHFRNMPRNDVTSIVIMIDKLGNGSFNNENNVTNHSFIRTA